MTDSEKLELLLVKMTDVQTDIGEMKTEMKEVKATIIIQSSAYLTKFRPL